jgi:2-oxo-4-hydroxy-4-carboxy--5-ureidoimidazoline (OHCU) decarboxylase
VLNRLNNAYWEKFGFPLIFAVREQSKESILENAEQRLKNSREQELETALGEIAKIARMRLQYLIRR